MIGQLFLDKALKIQGWMSEEELSFLAEVAGTAKSIIEIGSYRGRSARVLADNSPDDCKIHCVDPWNYNIFWNTGNIQTVDHNDFGVFYMNLADHIKSGKVQFHCLSWSDYFPIFEADFIFIDGDHTYDAATFDIGKALLHIKKDGVIAGHDYNWDSVKRAVDQYFPEVNVRDTIWSSKV